jgi:hypothetical protein
MKPVIFQMGVVVLCGASSLATNLGQAYSKQQLRTVSHQLTDSPALQAWTGAFQHLIHITASKQ